MCKLKVFIFLVTLCVVKSEDDFDIKCRNDFRNQANKTIDVYHYCSGKLCIQKCCRPNEIIINAKCHLVDIIERIKFKYLKTEYDSINILSTWKPNGTKKTFEFVQNLKLVNHLLACVSTDYGLYDVGEDGSLSYQDPVTKKWTKLEKLTFCLDYSLVSAPGGSVNPLKIEPVFKKNARNPNKMKLIEHFETVGVLISSFFLVLVLVVYCLLPDLRNLTGLVLMAYIFSILVGFLSKSVLTFLIKQQSYEALIGTCKILSPLIYFGFVSSIFWMSVYAFDVWWGIRGYRLRRSSKQHELVKFMWYCLFAWGTPILLTAVVTTLDNIPNLNLKPRPPFENCLQSGYSLDLYFKIPIGILILVNIVLFCMTVYNIWKITRGVTDCPESRSNKQQTNKFSRYAKLSVMMGVSWVLELLPAEDHICPYILVNTVNLLVGVIIFILFVCDRTILLQLCKKFNIKNNFTDNLVSKLARKPTKTGGTGSTSLRSSTVRGRSKDQSQDTDLLQNCPKEDTVV